MARAMSDLDSNHADDSAQMMTNSPNYIKSSTLKVLERQNKDPQSLVAMTPEDANLKLKAGHTIEFVNIDRLHIDEPLEKAVILKGVSIKRLSLTGVTCLKNFSLLGCHIKHLIIERCTFDANVFLNPLVMCC